MGKKSEGEGSLHITKVFKRHQGRVTVPWQENLGQVTQEQSWCRADQLHAEQDDGVTAPWHKAASEML